MGTPGETLFLYARRQLNIPAVQPASPSPVAVIAMARMVMATVV